MCSSGDSTGQEEEVWKWSSGSEVFFLSLQCARDAWMDKLPMSVLSEEQRRIQYLADVAREIAERITRYEMALDPNTPQKPRKVEYCTSEESRKSLSTQRQLDNIDVYCRK